MENNIKKYGVLILLILSLITTYCIFDSVHVKASPKKKVPESTNTVFVDIKGAVKKPGVYEVSSKSRIIDVIEKAGNLKKDADTSIINLSKKVKDEMYIIIYTKDQISEYKEKYNSSTKVVEEVEKKIICPDSDNEACINKSTKVNNSSKININTASLEELTTLSGIGEGKAKKIIEYREKSKFNKVEDILNVSGIGNSLYDKIKDNIEV